MHTFSSYIFLVKHIFWWKIISSFCYFTNGVNSYVHLSLYILRLFFLRFVMCEHWYQSHMLHFTLALERPIFSNIDLVLIPD